MMGRLIPTSSITVDEAVFNCKDWIKFISYQRKVQKSENYHDVMLKSFQPFIHVIESAAVRVFAFKPDRQWKACQKKSQEELENNVPGKRERPSEKWYCEASGRRGSADEDDGKVFAHVTTPAVKSLSHSTWANLLRLGQTCEFLILSSARRMFLGHENKLRNP
jgi:hypothetical protein